MFVNFLDTSAVLYGELKNNFEKTYISPITLMELENIKTSNKNEEVKYRAREAVRDIIGFNNIYIETPSQHAVEKILKKHSFLSDINDHHIICEASLLAKTTGYQVIFTTCDAAQSLFARRIGNLKVNYIDKNLNKKELDYCGWGRYYPSEDELVLLYSNPKMNVLNAKINEYCEIYEDKELKDILRWDGTEYKKLAYKEIKNPYLNEVIKPRNLEQKMAFNLLQNSNIRVKLLTSAWGGGKTLLALTYALEQVHNGRYNKLVFIRNNIIVADTNDIGYLPGDQNEKMLIWGMPLADHLGGVDVLEQLIEDKIIEIYPLSHIRGRSLRDSIVICDECENMNDKLITLLLSRVEDTSEIIFCGDVAQIDNKRFEKNNGIPSMIKNLSGEPLFGMVKLIKSERGGVPKLCDLMRPPI